MALVAEAETGNSGQVSQTRRIASRLRPAVRPLRNMKELITEEELKAFIVAVFNRYGLDFRNYEIKSLKRGITRLMMKHHMKSSLELWSRVLRERDFFMNSIDDLMVNLTELFRNPDAWIMIRDNILPQFKDRMQLDIWHAGCSTGEEVYTLAIVLDELGLLNRTRATATDLSATALEKAERGEYSVMTLKNYLKPFLKYYPNKEMSDFFAYSNSHANILPRFKKHVTYQRHNLVQEPMAKKYDIIFCRNVMIYFDESLKMKVLNLLDSSLKEGGYFVIGYYDTMPDASKEIFDIYDSKTRIYKKKI